jgi:transcription initiation factor TFIID subunit 2
MPGAIIGIMESPSVPGPVASEPVLGFIVSHQKVELNVDFPSQTISGHTEITILPQHRDLKILRFNARQCEIPHDGVQVNGRTATTSYEDMYKKLDIPKWVRWTAEQHEMQKDKIRPLLQTKSVLGELVITLPKNVRIEEVNPFSENVPSTMRDRAFAAAASGRSSSVAGATFGSISTPTLTTPKISEEQPLRFSPLTVRIPFKIKHFRDGLHFVGMEVGDSRYPHFYTRHSTYPGTACCIFPCIDDPNMRCTWEVTVRCGRTLGDALRKSTPVAKPHAVHQGKKGHGNNKENGPNGILSITSTSENGLEVNDEDSLLEMIVVCSGELLDEIPDPDDTSKKIVSFLCGNQVAAQHIGFAVGPFEQVDLSEFREDDEDEKLGQKAVQVHGYCLPRRADELRNTCATMAHAVDWLSLNFGSYPFPDYKVCFVDDQIRDTVPIASMSLCSTRLLLSEDIIDPEVDVTRQLVHVLASQWIGVNIIPSSRADTWAVVGISYFITDLFMKRLCGNNEYRFRQKTAADKLVELDVQRPCLYALGETLHLGDFEMEFMALKAPLVLFILDRRLMKSSGSSGLPRIISRLFYVANTGEQLSDKTISTEGFRRLCEKIGHYKVDSFFNQWVHGAGCPRFQVTQKFNKKRLSVEMTIAQKQETLPTAKKLEKKDFIREFKEETSGVYAGEIQPFFTGPMTIRIHEADGTPYEHIVEIREGVQRIEIPYHTKYKRLKRSRREKERATAGPGADISADNENDVLLYCLGDVLQSPEEVNEWGLVDWDPEIEQKMEQESYEWIRMDADFEWICELTINMPPYMYVSQLQQDRDVVAQQDSMLFLGKTAAHPLVSTILVRTLMDRRYFHGIRTMAADYLPKHATEATRWLGRIHLEKAFQEFFCYSGSTMPRSNNFTDKTAYLIQCAIPRAMAKIRNGDGKCPIEARQFILDQLRFNDNGSNEFSDYFYIANLMKSLAESLLPIRSGEPGEMNFSFDAEDPEELRNFQQIAVEEIDRYRRMDEWILSYHNIYTTTALQCKQKLMKSKVIPTDATGFFVYTHDGTLDLVRIKAFEALVDLGFFKYDKFLKYLLNVMSTDSSPFVRDRLYQVFGLALAAVAFGEHKEAEPTPAIDDGLIIEQDADMEVKKAKLARTMTIEGALAALKDELYDNTALQQAIWAAISSPDISLSEQHNLLDICFFIYDSVESMIVALPKPRYWKVEKRGNVNTSLLHLCESIFC